MKSRNIWRVILLVGALTLLAAALPIGASNANSLPPGQSFPLYAGQDMEVGTVTVANDTEFFYVTFSTVGSDYCMTETHLQLADGLAGVPQTKKGNPIPGQFDYSMDHDCVKTFTYPPIPIGDFVAYDDVIVAAHAKVKAPIGACTETVWQIGDVEQLEVYPEGTPNEGQELLTNYADEFNWEGATPYTAGPGLSANKPAFTTPFVVGTTPVSEFPYNSNATAVNNYATNIDVQWDGHLHFGGTLTVSWSPGQSANEIKVVSPGLAPSTFTQVGTPISGAGYFLDRYPVYEDQAVAAPLGTGTHTINFQHTTGDGTFWDWIRLERPCETYESAWGAVEQGETQFPGNNWATYFTYTVDKVLVETVQVPSENAVGISSTILLGDGVDYLLKASGTYDYGPGLADAQCSDRPGSAGWLNGDFLGSSNYLEVWVDGAAFDWTPAEGCQATHLYSGTYSGDGSTVAFFIPDSCRGGTLGCYGDNSGYITVEIWWLG